jgi:hypothetical protein
MVLAGLLEILEDVEVVVDGVVDNVADTGEDDVMETFCVVNVLDVDDRR